MSHCKACDKQLEGTQMDLGLCSECGEVSNFYLEIAQQDNEDQVGSRYAAPSTKRFETFVQKSGLRESWADGLGLMSPESRVAMLEARAWKDYCEYLSWGIGHEKALRRATGLSKRGNLQFDHSGAKGNQDEGETTEAGSKMVQENDLMGQEYVNWNKLWTDDL